MFAFSDWRLTGAGIPAGKASGDTGANTGGGRSLVIVREIESRGTVRAKTRGMKIEGNKRGAVQGDERFVAFRGGAAKASEDGRWRQHYIRLVCIDDSACWERGARLAIEANGERFGIEPGRYRSQSFDQRGASGHMTRIAYSLTPAQLTKLAEASSVDAQVGDYDFEFTNRHLATFTELHQKTAP